MQLDCNLASEKAFQACKESVENGKLLVPFMFGVTVNPATDASGEFEVASWSDHNGRVAFAVLSR